MKTGIVLKTDGRKAVVLKPDGSFVSVAAKKSWKTGDTVSFYDASGKHRSARLLAIAACLVLAVTGGFSWNAFYSAPIALISLDVNPSIELSVNRFDRIISVSALNEESTQILSETSVKHEAYPEALIQILNAEETNGYLSGGANVVLTVFAPDSAVQESLLAELQGIVDSRISLYSGQIRTEYHAVDETTVNGAHGHGVTAGKYLYLQELKELAPDTDISGFTHHSIEEIKGEIETCQQKHGAAGNGSHHRGGHN